MKHLFGPVPSRRLGLSLGVDLLGAGKHCNLNCVYCELGKSGSVKNERREFVPTGEVIAELDDFLKAGGNADVITISGSGEPGLALNLGEVIDGIRKLTDKKIAILTNGLLLCDTEVSDAMKKADMVLPSIDAASIEVFRKINRPSEDVNFNEVIDGIKQFGKEYKGELFLEILFVSGINDTEDEIDRLVRLVNSIPNVKEIQLNTVVRTGTEKSALALTDEKLADIQKLFGERARIIGSYSGTSTASGNIDDIIYSAVRLRPVTVEDLIAITGRSEEDVCGALNVLQAEKRVEKKTIDAKEFFQGI